MYKNYELRMFQTDSSEDLSEQIRSNINGGFAATNNVNANRVSLVDLNYMDVATSLAREIIVKLLEPVIVPTIEEGNAMADKWLNIFENAVAIIRGDLVTVSADTIMTNGQLTLTFKIGG